VGDPAAGLRMSAPAPSKPARENRTPKKEKKTTPLVERRFVALSKRPNVSSSISH
jgi:hypothetical protein